MRWGKLAGFGIRVKCLSLGGISQSFSNTQQRLLSWKPYTPRWQISLGAHIVTTFFSMRYSSHIQDLPYHFSLMHFSRAHIEGFSYLSSEISGLFSSELLSQKEQLGYTFPSSIGIVFHSAPVGQPSNDLAPAPTGLSKARPRGNAKQHLLGRAFD